MIESILINLILNILKVKEQELKRISIFLFVPIKSKNTFFFYSIMSFNKFFKLNINLSLIKKHFADNISIIVINQTSIPIVMQNTR